MFVLINDINDNIDSLKRDNSQLNRRNFLRSYMSYCEGDLTNFRFSLVHLIHANQKYRGNFDLNEYYPVLNKIPELNDRGKINLKTNKTPIIPLIKYSVRKYSEIIEFKKDLFSSKGWECFQKTVKIRNRITHPKEDFDPLITDEELKTIKISYRWWVTSFKKLRDQRNNFLLKNPDFKLFDFNK